MSDLISRNALCEYCLNTKDRTIDANDIMRFPSAKPQQKKGEWVNVGFFTCECSECGAQFHVLEYDSYCPNCGAYMRGADENA